VPISGPGQPFNALRCRKYVDSPGTPAMPTTPCSWWRTDDNILAFSLQWERFIYKQRYNTVRAIREEP